MENIAEIKVTYNPVKLGKISNSKNIDQFFRENWDHYNMMMFEEFKVLFFNNNLEIIGFKTIGQGGITSTSVDIRIIFSLALKALATGIVIAHNHPSGSLRPSQSDLNLTENIKNASSILNIQLWDHIILSPDGEYYSFADEGVL